MEAVAWFGNEPNTLSIFFPMVDQTVKQVPFFPRIWRRAEYHFIEEER